MFLRKGASLALAIVVSCAAGCAANTSPTAGLKPGADVMEASARRLIAVGQRFEREGRPELAAEIYERALQREPKNADARKRLAALAQEGIGKGHEHIPLEDDGDESVEQLLAAFTETKILPGPDEKPSSVSLARPPLTSSEKAVREKAATERAVAVASRTPVDAESPAPAPAESRNQREDKHEEAFVAEHAAFERFGEKRSFEHELTDARGSLMTVAAAMPDWGSPDRSAPGDRGDSPRAAENIASGGARPIARSPAAAEVPRKPAEAEVARKPAAARTTTPQRHDGWSATPAAAQTPAPSVALAPLLNCLESSSSIERIWGLTELSDLGREAAPARDAVRKLLIDENPQVSVYAADAMASLSGSLTESLPTFVAHLRSGDEEASQLAAYLLGRKGRLARDAVPALRQLRDARRGLTSLHAADALLRIDQQDTETLRLVGIALEDGRLEYRLFAAVSLGNVRGPLERSAAQYLIGALRDAEPQVRAAAALSLGELPTQGTFVRVELDYAARNDAPDVRAAAAQALARLAQAESAAPRRDDLTADG